MNDMLDLEKLERRAWRSTFSDGLWDLYLGWLLIALGVPLIFDQSGLARGWRYAITLGLMAVGMLALWLGKRYLTVPRLGWVEFSEKRTDRRRYLRWFLAGILGFTFVLWLTSSALNSGAKSTLPSSSWLAAGVWVLLVGASFVAMAIQFDYGRFYLIGFFYAIAAPLDEVLSALTGADLSGLAFALPGAVIIGLGAISLSTFLSKYPLPEGREAAGNG